MQRETLLDFFADFAGFENTFLVYDDGIRSWKYSYRETADAARGFAAELTSRGVHPGEKIVIWAENRPEWIFALWGCLLAGIVLVPVDYRTSPELLVRIAAITSARVILFGSEVIPPLLEHQPWRLKNLAAW